MSANQDTLYIKGDRDVELTKTEVTLGDILSLECSNKTVIPKIKSIKLVKFSEQGKKQQRIVVSVLKIIACIHEQYPNLDIQNLGETDIILTYENQNTPGNVVHLLKTAVVVVLVFCGSAFSIMAFHNDVSITKLFSQIYLALTGVESDGYTILEVSYSIGIIIGILGFFNHFGKKRFTVDPTPLEVQMRLYENDIQTTLVEDASRRKEELDVGKSNSAGCHRS